MERGSRYCNCATASTTSESPRIFAELGELIIDSTLAQIKGSRFTEKYLNTRYYGGSRSSSSSIYPPIPPRSPTFKSSTSSPPRKVVTDFAAFRGTPAAHSMFGSAATAVPTFGSPRGKMSFGGIRGPSPDIDPDDVEEEAPAENAQRIGLSEGAITLDQVREISFNF